MAAKDKKDDGTPEGVIVIKKYANRRLYNTAKSSYVTLEHLAQMVRDGEDFVVRDAKSGEDITRSVLTQIIFEEEAKGQNMLPTNFLRSLIRLYGDTLQGFVPSYLETSMETFISNQESLREQVTRAFGGNQAMSSFEAMTRTNMEMFDNAMRMFTPFSTGMPPPPAADKPSAAPAASAGAGDDKAELDDLKTRLEEMQAELAKLARKS